MCRGFGFHVLLGLERVLLALQPAAAVVVGAVNQYRGLQRSGSCVRGYI